MNKVCKQCGESKDSTEFYPNRGICKICKSSNDAECHRKQIERDPSVRDKRSKVSAQWRQNHREQYNEYQRQYTRSLADTPEYKAKTRVRSQERRELACASLLTASDWLNIVQLFDYSCAYCGTKHKITMDHVVPVSKGGQTTVYNVIPACASCNSSKYNKELIEWYTQQVFYSEERLEAIIKFVRR